MYLLNVYTGDLEFFQDDRDLHYAILSHRWQEDEVLLQDIERGEAAAKAGYVKLKQVSEVAKRAGFTYVWVDTCCIDKMSSALLSESINSMYRWYQNAAVCYAYLYDVESTGPGSDAANIATSDWFTRGWTLQELLAPRSLTFYDCNWKYLGTKAEMIRELVQITGIQADALRGDDLGKFSVAQRMSWASNRVTLRVEDIAYSLLGIFGVNMPLLYGEGERAFIRLQEEIIRRSNDQSIFAHVTNGETQRLLAESPADFGQSNSMVQSKSRLTGEPYSLTNMGLSAEFILYPWALDTYIALLDCRNEEFLTDHAGIFLRLRTQLAPDQATAHAIRVKVNQQSLIKRPQISALPATRRRVYVEERISSSMRVTSKRYGYWIRSFEGENAWAKAGKLRAISWNEWDPSERIVEMPAGVFATVGIVIWECESFSTPLRLAFSESFEPIIEFGSADTWPEGELDDKFKQTILTDMRWVKTSRRDNTMLLCSNSRDLPLRETRQWGLMGGVRVVCEKMEFKGSQIWGLDVLWRMGSDGLPKNSPAFVHVICDGCQADVYGQRYHCRDCKDFDFCVRCIIKKQFTHDASHRFDLI